MQAHDGSRPVKKRKTKATSDFAAQHHPEKPSARFEASASRASLSIALPGSILLNAQNEELKAVLAAQIARSAAIFGVSEIVVFKEDPPLAAVSHGNKGKYRKVEEDLDENAYLAKILEYLETPQYLRKALFPMQPILRHVGLLPPLDMPHHLRKSDISRFREGVTLASTTSLRVDVGLDEPAVIAGSSVLPEHTRVTVDLEAGPSLVSASIPRQAGIPWGYSVRVVPSLGHALVPADPAHPYDLLIGLSERGTPISKLPAPADFPKYTRALVVLGGLAGLELSVEKEKDVLGVGAEESAMLFDYWVNVLPGQASRTIRTEEALQIGLAGLWERLSTS